MAVGCVRWLIRPLWPRVLGRGRGGAGPVGRRARPSPPRHCLWGIRCGVGDTAGMEGRCGQSHSSVWLDIPLVAGRVQFAFLLCLCSHE